MFSKLLKNDYLLNLLNKIYTIFIGLLSSVFLTRYLGVIYKGNYTYIIQVVLVFTIILNLGIHQSYSYFYRKYSGDVFSKYVNLYTFQFLLNTMLAVALSILVNNKLYFYALILLPFSVMNRQMQSTMAVENIRLKIKLHMFNVTVRMFSFVIMFLFAERSLLSPILITIGINTMSITIYLYFSKVIPRPLSNDFVFIKEVLTFSWLPMLTALLITFNYSVDIFFLKHMGIAVELGLYSTAVGIVNYFWLIPDSFKEVLVSRIARSHSTKSTVLAIKVSVTTVIIVIIAFIFLGQFAINLLYGAEFADSYNVTLLLSLGAISMVFYKMIGVVFLSEGKRWFYFLALLISVLANIISNIITIPLYGMYGAALSSIISYSICGISFLVYFIWDKKLNVLDVILLKSSEIKQFKNALKRR